MIFMRTAKKIVLVDGSSYLFRAFHALPQLTNSEGEPTGVLFGIINMLKKLPKQLDTNYIAVIFDAKGKNFRHQLYPEYKANRKAMADELRAQIHPVYTLVQKLGFPLISITGVEADDVIGTLAKRFAKAGHQIIISTGDKDMAQLVDDQISLIDTMKNKALSIKEVIQKFGVKPTQMIDYLALVGDISDNIPGISKVGPKTAVKWLHQYQSLTNIMAHASEISGKVGENLRQSLDHLPLSYQLATIKCDLDLPYTLQDMACQKPDIAYLKAVFHKYEFKGLLRALEHEQNSTEKTETSRGVPKTHYEIIFDWENLEKLCQDLRQSTLFAFDTETDTLDTLTARLVGISFSLRPYHGVYIPLQHDYTDAPRQLGVNRVIHALRPILEDKNISKIAQHAKFDCKILASIGIRVEGMQYDTMLESYVYHSTATRHNLDSLAREYLHYTPTSFEALAGKGKKQLRFNQIDITKAGNYAAEDADVTFRLHQYLWPRIRKIDALHKLYIEKELPVSLVIAKMEQYGVKIDSTLLEKQSDQLQQKIRALEAQCIALSGEHFNLASAQQLAAILYDKMALPVLKKTPGGKPSTSEEVLQTLAEIYTLPKVIIEHRHLSKLTSTYTDKLPLMVHPKTGRVHTSYHQAVTSTGRLSSSDPNLQNIPIRSSVGREIRQAFIAPKGYQIVAADYSQIELRIMAHLSQDRVLLKAFHEGFDIHQTTAAETLGITLNQVTSEQRRQAKAVNFGLIYGMGAFGLAKQLGISRTEARDYIDVYFTRYPQVKAYMEKTKANALQQGFVQTIFGRRLYLPDIHSHNMIKKRAAERLAINAPMQGSAADIIKRAMINIDQWIMAQKKPIHMIMQVHDELVFEVKENEIYSSLYTIQQLMASAAVLSVPLVVDIGIGNNWDEAH